MSKQVKLTPIFTCHKCGRTDLTEAPLQIKSAPGRHWKHETCGAIVCPSCGGDPGEGALCERCQMMIEQRRNRDYIDVTPRSEPNPDWSYTDPKGHVHTYTSGTWKYVEDHPATDEYPASSHHECKKCGARVVPGTRSVRFRQYI